MAWRWTPTDPLAEAYDVVVVGGGPAGIMAAGAAAGNGRHVLLIDRRPQLGGNVWYPSAGQPPVPEAAVDLSRLRGSGLRVLTGAEVLDRPRPGKLLVGSFEGWAQEVAYSQLVIATGARERFLPFPGWTLPNVVGVGALQLLGKSGAPVKGRSVVIAGSGPLLLAATAYLREQGAEVKVVAEQSSRWRVWRLAAGLVSNRERFRQALDLQRRVRGIPYRYGCWPVRAEGSGRVERVVLRQGNRTWTEGCDLLACGYHLVPNLELAELLGCRLRDGFVAVDEYQESSVPGVYCAGEPVGIGGLELARVEGEIAGLSAAQQREKARNRFADRRRLSSFRAGLRRAFALNPALRGMVTPSTVVCRCEDVRAEAVAPYLGGRDARLQTRCGMGRCQGRVCGPAAEFLWGWTPRGTRPPITPATVDQLTLSAVAEGAPGAT